MLIIFAKLSPRYYPCTGYLAHPFEKSDWESESDSLDSLQMDESTR
jgi:hypothetical protein